MKKYRRIVVTINEKGYRIGLSHHRAFIEDQVIDAIRDLHEENGLTYGQLSIQFNLSRGTIAKICRYERRAQTPHDWKTIRKEED